MLAIRMPRAASPSQRLLCASAQAPMVTSLHDCQIWLDSSAQHPPTRTQPPRERVRASHMARTACAVPDSGGFGPSMLKLRCSPQSHLQPSTYRPSAMSAGISTRSTISRSPVCHHVRRVHRQCHLHDRMKKYGHWQWRVWMEAVAGARVPGDFRNTWPAPRNVAGNHLLWGLDSEPT